MHNSRLVVAFTYIVATIIVATIIVATIIIGATIIATTIIVTTSVYFIDMFFSQILKFFQMMNFLLLRLLEHFIDLHLFSGELHLFSSVVVHHLFYFHQFFSLYIHHLVQNLL